MLSSRSSWILVRTNENQTTRYAHCSNGTVSTMPHEEQEILIAPENFAMVERGVYRSAFPRTKNMSFLDSLQLKSVVSLVLEDYPAPLVEFYKRNGVELMTMGVEGNKGAFKGIDIVTFLEVMRVVMNDQRRPLLIHCNKGKHRTGCVVGCLRRLRGWSVSCIVDEYMLMACPKPRLEDQRFIETFDVNDFHSLPPPLVKEKKKKKKKVEEVEVVEVSSGDAQLSSITADDENLPQPL